MQSMAKLIALIIIAGLCLGFGQPANGKMVEDVYVVKSGDCLNNIAAKFIVKNTYGRRGFDEFQEGIYELNYEQVFMEREKAGRAWPKMVFPGDRLVIRYWVRDEQ